ncbi:MAG: glycosyltransferase [Acetobacteraceae bacterium]|nr:glycosyltransferase [Acetobacteraceae bacterium]
MKFLFVHQNFPGQFLHIIRHLVEIGGHEIVFITEPNLNNIDGIRKVPYAKPRPASADTHIAARELDVAARRAEIVARTAHSLKQLGFTPDIMIGHAGWGEMLNLGDVWPGVPVIRYMEFYYRTDSADVIFDPEFPIDSSDFARIRAKNAINHISLNLDGNGVTPTEWQLSTYPEWAQAKIDLMWEGVNLDVCSPDAKVRQAPLKIGDMTIRRDDVLVTYVSRDLEPYRGVHTMLRALPDLLRARKNLKVVMVGGDGVSYGSPPPGGGTWRELLIKEVAGQIDPARVLFPGRIEYQVYLSMLRRSDAHVYLTYPFVASWSLREALAVGCAIVGADTEPVREFITHGQNGLLTSFFDPRGLANSVLEVVENKKLARALRTGARNYAERNLAMADYIRGFSNKIESLTGLSLHVPEQRSVPAVKGRRAKR